MSEPPDRTAAAPRSAPADGPSGPRASFGRRLVAAIVDGIFVDLVAAIVAALAGRGAGYGIGALVSVAYFTYFEGAPAGQTLGKRALGIRVVDAANDGSIGHGRAFVRWVGRIVSFVVLLLGYFWMLWDREKQTWHDKIAGTVVVPVRDYPVGSWP